MEVLKSRSGMIDLLIWRPLMNTHKSIYGYLNAALHFANPQGSFGSERSLFYPDPLDYVDNSPEEILYKSYWEAYFNDKPST
jgi:hypothetical protein